jgi:heavy metal sensor kinase
MAAFTLFSGFMYFAVTHFLQQQLQHNLTRRAHQVERTLLGVPNMDRAQLANEIAFLFAPESSSRFIRISQNRTNIIYTSGSPHDASFNANVPMPDAPAHEGFRSVAQGQKGSLLIRSLVIEPLGEPTLIEFGAPVATITIAVNRMILALLIGAPLVIIVAAFGAQKLIDRSLSPVVSMASSAEEISLHNLSERLPSPRTADELETLTLALNRMIGRIQEALDQNRRFVADASHELRTPLAILRGELENVVTHNHLAPATRETLGSNLEEVDRLGKIVEGLFALSRLDAGEAQSESIILNLAKLAVTTTEQMCLLAEDKAITLVSTSETPVFVRGDSSRLKQVIVNLVDNAVKYTPNGGRVEVKVYAADDKALLEVNDNGIGIPKTDLPHVFERFYRVDKARSREFGGAGLGLSIVQSICAAHGGNVDAISDGKQGSSFIVRLPLAAAEPILNYDNLSSTGKS